MVLAQEELMKLYYHGGDHPLLKVLSSAEITAWYNSIPDSKLPDLVKVLTALDRRNYFAFTDFPAWYSQFCQKIIDNTTIKIFGLTNSAIDDIAVRLLAGLVERQLTEHTMQKLVQDMIRFEFNDLLSDLLICLGADNKFSELTLIRLNIELAPYPRWLSLGLSAAPTQSECEPLVVINP